MEYLAYASMIIANEGENIDIEYHLPELEFNWKKGFKSAWLNFASIGALVTILVQAQVASAAYYVNTNGSCLNVRTGPGSGYPTVTCIGNGERLKPIVKYYNGYAQLSSGNWVSGQWISTTSGDGYSPGLGVGGQYPDYFHGQVSYETTHRYCTRRCYHHRHHVRHIYSYNPRYSRNNYNYTSEYSRNDYNYSPGYSGNSYDHPPGYSRNDYNNSPGYSRNDYNYPPGYSGSNYDYQPGSNGNDYNYPPRYSGSNYDYQPGSNGNDYNYPPGYGYRS